ncbi:DUF1351 domain-containing protein [Streptococcus fryi]
MKDVTNIAPADIKVDFQPAAINLDYDSVERQLAAIVEQYTNYEVTASTYKIDYDERTRLNKLKEAFEEKRKEIKNNINNPYKEFEKWYKKTVEPLDNVIDNITAGLNAIDEHERLMRVDVVRATFEDRCMVAGILKDTFESKYEEYALKKYFKKGKFELKKTTLDEIDALVHGEFEALEQYKANKQAVVEQAQEYGLPANSYITHLEDGKTLVDVLKIMKSDRDAEILRKEQQEAEDKAKAERLAEIDRMAKENANAQIKAYDADTGEIIENDTNTLDDEESTVEVANFDPSEPLTPVVQLSLHGGNPQWEQVKEYFEDNFIGFEVLGYVSGT